MKARLPPLGRKEPLLSGLQDSCRLIFPSQQQGQKTGKFYAIGVSCRPHLASLLRLPFLSVGWFDCWGWLEGAPKLEEAIARDGGRGL